MIGQKVIIRSDNFPRGRTRKIVHFCDDYESRCSVFFYLLQLLVLVKIEIVKK